MTHRGPYVHPWIAPKEFGRAVGPKPGLFNFCGLVAFKELSSVNGFCPSVAVKYRIESCFVASYGLFTSCRAHEM